MHFQFNTRISASRTNRVATIQSSHEQSAQQGKTQSDRRKRTAHAENQYKKTITDLDFAYSIEVMHRWCIKRTRVSIHDDLVHS